MFERQRAKADERVRAAMASRLRPGENVRTSVMGAGRVPILPLVASVALASASAQLAGFGDWSPFVTGAAILVFFVLFVRTHYIVLTDQRLLVLRCRRASSKVVSDEWEARRGEGTPSYNPGALAAYVRLDLDKGPTTVQVQWAFADRARALVKEASAVRASD